MTAYSIILFVHVIATLGLAGAMTVEGIALRQLRVVPLLADTRAFLDSIQQMRPVQSICLLILFLSGGYLTHRLSFWQLAWPKIALLILIAFGALAGFSGAHLRRIQRTVKAGDIGGASVLRASTARFLRISLDLRIGLVLAAVFLMTVKPDLTESLGALIAFVLISLGCGLLGSNTKPEQATASHLDFGETGLPRTAAVGASGQP